MKSVDLMCACATARNVARTLTQLYDTALRDTGLEAPQFALLMTLERKEPCTQAALGQHHALDKTTVSRNVRWLEQQGWVRSAPGSDRRARVLQLTPEGRRKLVVAKPAWRRVQDQLSKEMTSKEWHAMFAAFSTVSAAVRRIKSR
jgi:DNA-binding MarR family transcriptional regulator